MKKYTTDNPEFSESISVLESTDTNHADNFNVSTLELFKNTLANRRLISSFSYSEKDEALIIPSIDTINKQAADIIAGNAQLNWEYNIAANDAISGMAPEYSLLKEG